MRFNPKADISRGRVSDAGGSGGGGGGPMRIPIPGGTRAGGGIGGILIIILFVVLTQCMGGGLPGGGGGADTQGQSQGNPQGIDPNDERYANCKTGADAQDDPDCARKAFAVSLEDYWAKTLPEQGNTEFRPATINTFAGAVQTGCGQASSQVGPFYCPPDEQIYLDTSFFQDVLEGQLGGKGGDFVEAYVLGHEYGHHIQNLLGTMGQVRTQKGADSDAVRLELQADCYAGMWTKDASDGDGIFAELDEGDIKEALDSAKAVGDDRIQQRSGQGVNPDGWTHGSSEERMRWFTTGYQQGTLQACDTFSADQL
ncbi:MAG TPA: neutral zinc metallopeptidase [Nocardioides sp.]